MKLNKQGFCPVLILKTKLDRKKHVACSSIGVCKPGNNTGVVVYDQPKGSSRGLLLRPHSDPSKEEVMALAMPLMGVE